ncbi:MAG: phosphoribosylaminoimidazolesuccinocarboxamide synthase [Phycisphaeraceae bacterium]|nr:phosphoribosylaminoimidazolesuccinocarboxamide synthase [Phycisphaeraceae bacterium]
MVGHTGQNGAVADGLIQGLRLPVHRSGKVRDVYELPVADGPGAGGEGRLLFVASDRISAFDVVLPTPITGKGRLLTQIAAWWFGFITEHRLAETHLISTQVSDIDAEAFAPGAAGDAARRYLEGRLTIGRRCRVVPIECVVRGYLEGSGWKEYQQTGSVCGVDLPKGLKQCDRLPRPIFTPATKASHGHDENISFEAAAEIAGLETMSVLRETSLKIYDAAAAHALSRGIIIADTKFEFGIPEEDVARSGRAWVQPILIDEALTPDSSRFWPADSYEPGRAQASYDKQFVREYLEGLTASGAWDKTPPGPALPDEVVRGTVERYTRARDALCG